MPLESGRWQGAQLLQLERQWQDAGFPKGTEAGDWFHTQITAAETANATGIYDNMPDPDGGIAAGLTIEDAVARENKVQEIPSDWAALQKTEAEVELLKEESKSTRPWRKSPRSSVRRRWCGLKQRVFARPLGGPLGHLSSYKAGIVRPRGRSHACAHRKALEVILSSYSGFFLKAFGTIQAFGGFFSSSSARSPAKISVLFLEDLDAALQRLTAPSLTVGLPLKTEQHAPAPSVVPPGFAHRYCSALHASEGRIGRPRSPSIGLSLFEPPRPRGEKHLEPQTRKVIPGVLVYPSSSEEGNRIAAGSNH